MNKAVFIKVGVILTTSAVIASCSSITAPFRDADPRWADFKSWTKVTSLAPQTGDPTGFLAGVHNGTAGYRDVYVNDIGKAALLGSGPYNLPEGTVIVKEQFKNKAAWESGKGAGHTISIKKTSSAEVSGDNWIWASSYKGSAGKSAFCADCHAIAAKGDYAFTTGDFLKKHK